MHLNLKRVASTALAVVMSLGLSVTAFAEGNGGTQTLTVTGETLGNKTVYAVKMFDARATTADDGASYSFDSYELATEWEGFFQTELSSEKTGSELSEEAVTYVSGLNDDDDKLVSFAHKAQEYVRSDEEEGFTVLSVAATNGTATFTNLAAGYYLVYPEGGSYTETVDDGGSGVVPSPRGSDAMLVNVPRGGNAEWNIKSTFPTVDKKVDTDNDGEGAAADNGSAQVGDIVTFTLTSKVPDMSDYNTFYFGFIDTLTSGLKIVDSTGSAVPDGNSITIDNLTVTIDGQKVESNYTVSLQGNVLKVEFTNLKMVAGDSSKVGKDIVVTYQAMITEAAVVGTPALNTVKVEYSNDPTTNTKGESTPDESKVFTYEIDVNKYADTVENLPGAEFILSTNATAPTAEEIEDEYVGYTGLIKLVGSGQAYRVAKPDESGVNSFTTTEKGDITISGLEAGTYYLHEVAAPEGYNKLKAPITIVITMTNNPEVGDATITVDGDDATGDDGTTVDVENKKGIELPETGSIGTIGLTAAGVAIVLLGVFAPRKKKKGTQE